MVECFGKTGSAQEIRDCTAKDCPLYKVRQYK